MSLTDDQTRSKPDKTVTLNTRPDTYVGVTFSPTDGYLLYRPEDNAFIALYPQEFFEIRHEGETNNDAIKALQAANQAVSDKSIALAELKRNPTPSVQDLKAAQDALDQALSDLAEKSEAAKSRVEPIVDLKTDQDKLVELLPLTMRRSAGHKSWYVKASKLKSAMADKRVYLVEGKPEREKAPKGKLLNGTQLNHEEVKRRIAEKVVDKAKFSKKWQLKPEDADEYAGQFFSDWAKSMGGEAKDFLEREQQDIVKSLTGGKLSSDPKDPHRNLDLKSEAQLMRWSAGGGLELDADALQGNLDDKRDKDWKARFKRAAKSARFGIKANAEAAFSLAEAKVDTTAYYPHYAGWHLQPAAANVELDLGHFRLCGDMSLYAVAGASIAIEASAGLMLTAGKQGLRGVPPDKKAAKAKVGADAKADVFAGLKEGIDLKGSLQWLNPEGFIDPKNPVRKKPTKTWGEYADIASVTAGAAAIQGLAASLGFEVDYRNGNFVIAAKASACLGLGGSGNVGAKVGADSIGQFFMCIAHQLKQADYKKLVGLMSEDVFDAFNQIFYMIQSGFESLDGFVKSGKYLRLESINDAYEASVSAALKMGDKFVRELEKGMQSQWGWFAYMMPEARGAMIATIQKVVSQPRYSCDDDLRKAAAFCVNEMLATAQTGRHLDKTLERVTIDVGDKVDPIIAINDINSILIDSKFSGGLQRAQKQVIQASPMILRPFMRNDGGDFATAKLPFSHLISDLPQPSG